MSETFFSWGGEIHHISDVPQQHRNDAIFQTFFITKRMWHSTRPTSPNKKKRPLSFGLHFFISYALIIFLFFQNLFFFFHYLEFLNFFSLPLSLSSFSHASLILLLCYSVCFYLISAFCWSIVKQHHDPAAVTANTAHILVDAVVFNHNHSYSWPSKHPGASDPYHDDSIFFELVLQFVSLVFCVHR